MHLHNHSRYSIVDGRGLITDYLQKAKDDGQEAFALTDHGSIGGAIELYQEAKKLDIKPIIGCEMYVDAFELRERNYPGHLTVLAKNEDGYRALIAANNLGHSQFYYRPRVTLSQLIEGGYMKDWIVLSGCMSSPIFDWPMTDALNIVQELKKHSGGFFLEAMWHYSEDLEFQAKERLYQERVAEIYKATGIPIVLTNDCHYVEERDELIHHDFIQKTNSKELEFDGLGFHMRTAQEMQEIAQCLGIPNAVDNAISIAKSCSLVIPEADDVSWYVPDITGGKPEETIRSICYPILNSKPREYTERFEYEMSVLKTSPAIMNSYLVARDVVEWCSNNNIPVAARGSMAGSIVSWLLGITLEDPVKYNLSFSRAVSPARPTIPDFDLDVSSIHRQTVLEYIAERYDETRPIGAFTHYGPKGSFRKILRQEGLRNPKEINDLCRELPDDWTDGDFAYSPRDHKYVGTSKWTENVPAEYHDWMATYKGLFSNVSVHPSGVLLGGPERNLEHEVPMQWVASSKTMASQFDMYSLKNIGMFKLDILGLRALDQLAYMRNTANDGPPNDDYDDVDVLEAFSIGLLSEAFQMDGYAAHDAIKKINGITTFEDLVAVNALCRPGAKDFIPEYRSGSIRMISAYPELKDVLGYTNGLILYQEQVMEIGRVLAGFNDYWQDKIKESIKYFKHDTFINEIGPKFLEGCLQTTGHDGQLMLDAMLKFAGYAFNRAHAMTYAALAYKMMWYKVHYPAVYYAAVFDECKDRSRLVLESHFFNVNWLPADVNQSEYETRVRGNDILLGLGAIKGVGPAAFQAIAAARPYVSLQDMESRIQKNKCNSGVRNNLINAFACNSIGEKGNYSAFNEAFGFPYTFMDPKVSFELRAWEKEASSFRVAGYLTSVIERETKNGPNAGSKFGALTVTNPLGERKCVIWPPNWSKMKKSLYTGKAVKLYGSWAIGKDFSAEGDLYS